jgi:hypothetical protein
MSETPSEIHGNIKITSHPGPTPPQFVTDAQGNRTSVPLAMDEYECLLEMLDDLQDTPGSGRTIDPLGSGKARPGHQDSPHTQGVRMTDHTQNVETDATYNDLEAAFLAWAKGLACAGIFPA